MNKYNWVEECEGLIGQLNLFDKSKEEALVMCICQFEPYKRKLVKQGENLKELRDSLKNFTPYGFRKETHETFNYTYTCLNTCILSLGWLNRNVDLYVARLAIPYIVSPNGAYPLTVYLRKFNEYKESLSDVIKKFSILTELLENTILKDTREENRNLFRLIRQKVKDVIYDLCELVEELDKCVFKAIKPYVSFEIF